MKDEIVRTQQEIDEMVDKANEGLNNGSVYPSMNYEEGVKAMYDWLVGNTEDKPFD